MKIIDLSKPIQFNAGDPRFMQVCIKHKRHGAAKLLVWLLGLPRRLFPKDFVGWADDTITKMGVHATTHIDAPWHYGPTSGGQPAQTIDEIPLEKCIGPGVVLDMTNKADDDPITVSDMEIALAKTGANIDENTIVLIRTGRDTLMGTKAFWTRGTGMSAAATEWLLDRGPTVMGIDQWGWDLPFRAQIRELLHMPIRPALSDSVRLPKERVVASCLRPGDLRAERQIPSPLVDPHDGRAAVE